jgi:hypothetical protein
LWLIKLKHFPYGVFEQITGGKYPTYRPTGIGYSEDHN